MIPAVIQQQSPRGRSGIHRFNDRNVSVTLKNLHVKLFADGADKAQIFEMAKQSWSVASRPTLRS
jgi:hypothetical protein